MTIRPALIPEEVGTIRDVFREYQSELGISLCFQDFENELARLPGNYAPPRGRLLLADAIDELAGCIALRPSGGDSCEMKRLYVRPNYRGMQLGRQLVERLLQEANQIGYRTIFLDTLPSMQAAIALYRRMGFEDTEPYYPNPVANALFLKKTLANP